MNQKVIRLLANLVGHIDCATSEDQASEVLCPGCYESLQRAREWLDINDPSWRKKHMLSIYLSFETACRIIDEMSRDKLIERNKNDDSITDKD